MKRVALLGIAALVAMPEADARACSLATPLDHIVDPSLAATDQTAPTLPRLAPHIERGHGPEKEGCTTSAMSCDDIGTITFLADATDDTTPPERIGYRFSLAAGTLPTGLSLPTGAIDPFPDGLHLHWIDGASDSQEDIDFTLSIVAIDLAGNESSPRSVRVVDEPGHACAVAPGHGPRPVLVWIALAALLVTVRRRRPA